MKKNKKIKLVALAITGTIFLTGCQREVLAELEKYKIDLETGVFPSMSITDGEIELTEEDIKELEGTTYPDIGVEIISPTTPTEETKNEMVESSPEDTEELKETESKEDIQDNTEKSNIDENNQETVNQGDVEEKQESEEQTPIISDIGYTNNETVLHSGDYEHSPIITNLDINTQIIKIFSNSNGWDLVKVNEFIGYIKTEEITYTEEQQNQEYIYTPYNDIVVTTTTLNFREAPNAESKRILTFNIETELQVIAKIDNGWLLVRYNGMLGYVHGDYVISMLEMAQNLYPELQLSELDVQKIVYPTTSLNIRCGSSIEFESLGLLEKYETLRVLGEYEDWYFVMTNERNFGFVSKKYTEIIAEKCIVVDKSCQQLYYYENQELLYTTEVTTGKDSTPSDTGLFSIKTKAMYVTLTDNETYWSDVVYWLRYNGGEGIHDSDWRFLFNDPKATWTKTFGSESYHTHGSHGCINTPYEVVEKIYHEVELGDKVLVHK